MSSEEISIALSRACLGADAEALRELLRHADSKNPLIKYTEAFRLARQKWSPSCVSLLAPYVSTLIIAEELTKACSLSALRVDSPQQRVKRVETAMVLIAHCDRKMEGALSSAFLYAAQGNLSEVVSALISHCDIKNACGEPGRSALFYAAKFGSNEALFELLAAGADSRGLNENGLTPLMVCGKISAPMVEALAGVSDIRNRDKNGRSTLGWLAMDARFEAFSEVTKNASPEDRRGAQEDLSEFIESERFENDRARLSPDRMAYLKRARDELLSQVERVEIQAAAGFNSTAAPSKKALRV